MAQKYYNTADAAKLLGTTVDEIKRMLERHELHGYRDGADWKFKVEDIDGMVKDLPAKPPAEEGGDVLLSEVALGQSDPGLSGTVIGMTGPGARLVTDSDVRLADSDFKLEQGSKGSGAQKKPMSESKFEELELTLDNDLTLQDSTVMSDSKPSSTAHSAGGSSFIDLGGKEDDDLVLGGSSSVGSDVTLGGDSGISLIDPSDSGLSLETPVNLGAVAEEALELGEDENRTTATASVDSSTQLKTDDDFLLTPLEETTDIEDSESGSQVIALDTEAEAGVSGAGVSMSMANMLDEDLTTQPVLDMGVAAPMAGVPVLGGPSGALEQGPALQPSAGVYEAPYSGWQIAGLVVCALLLLLCGMITYDLLRNMWSWEGTVAVNSQLMDTILGLVGEK